MLADADSPNPVSRFAMPDSPGTRPVAPAGVEVGVKARDLAGAGLREGNRLVCARPAHVSVSRTTG